MKRAISKNGASRDIFLPTGEVFSEEDLWQWYGNIGEERYLVDFQERERSLFEKYYRESGLLTRVRREYFRQHFCKSFYRASSFLLESKALPHILDLGCGSGTQSLFLAVRGASVLALDMDEVALSLLKRRKLFYESLLGQPLHIDIRRANTLTFDYASVDPLDGVYSMFAFNMMQPSQQVISSLMNSLSAHARLAIIDGNSDSWLPKLIPSRRRPIWSPQTFREELEAQGFSIRDHRGGVSLPPFLWLLGPRKLLEWLDEWSNQSWVLPVSHQILACRSPGA